MRKATLATSAALAFVVLSSALPALAAIEPNTPKILLHIRPVTTKNACTTWLTSSLPSCETANVQADLGTYFVYVVVAKGDSLQSVAGMQLGVTYDNNVPGNISDGTGIDMFGWTLCATLQFTVGPPNWTQNGAEPGSGNLITWDADNVCQLGPIANAGFFYLSAYTASTLWVIPRPVDSIAKVATCQAQEVQLPIRALGSAAFSAGGGTQGCNPCNAPCPGVVPTQSTTWGSIKSLYNGN